ncbi:MAG TPA: MlaD family protein [Solirubrobacterales bacterium]|jgi:phospholipid/cholesterol/gamma-HCH transport system substrate-binding protein|nr:MlaD family protein [Solirubrobacterales bacterium]
MSEQPQQRSRWRHFRASLSRQARGRGKDTIAIAILTVVAIVMTLWIFTQQKASLPSWAPFVGEDFVHLSADFSNAQAITPGQGQAVVIAGVQIGKISSVDLEEGHAVVGMDVEPKYLELIHSDATLLLRPKTNLNDMTVEISPGEGKGHVEAGHDFPLSQTEPSIPFEAFLSILDADTRQYIQLLVAGGAQGIGGHGRQLSGAFRRLQPFAHYIADLNRAVAQRRVALTRVIHDFGLLTTELGRRDAELERFVSGSKAALGNFANQQQSIQESLVEAPATLTALRSAMASSNRFSTVARPALLGLIPQVQALGPALEATKQLFQQTTAPIRDQIRPFVRETRPVLTHTRQFAGKFDTTVDEFGNSLGALNSFLNELAYKPKGSRQSLLFYLPWLNHDLNASFNLSDGGGPVFRGQALLSCNGSYLAYNLTAGVPSLKPFLKTVLQGLRIPSPTELPPIPEDKRNPGISCGPK